MCTFVAQAPHRAKLHSSEVAINRHQTPLVPPSVRRDQEIDLSRSKIDLVAPHTEYRSSKEQKRPTGRRAKESYWHGTPGTAARCGLSRKSDSRILPWAAPPPPPPPPAADDAAAVRTTRSHAPHATIPSAAAPEIEILKSQCPSIIPIRNKKF